jgi:replication factor C small subunit
MGKLAPLLSETLRPLKLGDLALPNDVIERLQKMIETKRLMNMLFYGPPGVGKTSAAQIIMKALGPNGSLEIDGSRVTGVDFIRDRVEGFASAVSLYGGLKICFIDEADYLPRKAQAALRKIIEKMSVNCRFILAANDRKTLVAPLESRLQAISFKLPPSKWPEVLEKLLRHYEATLSAHGMLFDKRRLEKIVSINFPDFRAIANQIEFEAA